MGRVVRGYGVARYVQYQPPCAHWEYKRVVCLYDRGVMDETSCVCTNGRAQSLELNEEQNAFQQLLHDLKATEALDEYLARTRRAGPSDDTDVPIENPSSRSNVIERTEEVLSASMDACTESRRRIETPPNDVHPFECGHMSQACRFTDRLTLDPFVGKLAQVPRIVNVVTLATVDVLNDGEGRGSATGVPTRDPPLNLRRIASMCTGAYFAPARFTAVQIAFKHPRCRVLVFHTGRLVGTGTNGTASSRVAIMLAQKQLARDAGVILRIRTFDVINIVGAASLNTGINCDSFADAHSSEAHFDKSSFVGMTWRHPLHKISVEVYSTGRANLPGAKSQRQLLGAFATLLPEMLRFSSVKGTEVGVPALETNAWRASSSAARGPRRTNDTNSSEVVDLGDDVFDNVYEADDMDEEGGGEGGEGDGEGDGEEDVDGSGSEGGSVNGVCVDDNMAAWMNWGAR